MSTTETQAVPTGTWTVDKVHSQIGFEAAERAVAQAGD